ncbi:MAG: (Fe-S)-binding protein [Planctomycetia bacterium]|nr:MAG: (Fe-S)-binding protein [Planctomycetia bacterium]
MGAIVMSVMLVVGLGLFAITARRRWRLMMAAGAPDPRFNDPAARIAGVLRYVLGQARMFRYRAAGIAHGLIFVGFVVLGLRTVILVARGFVDRPDFGFWLFDDGTLLGNAYGFVKDLLSLLVIVGVSYFLYARLVTRPRRMELSTEGVVILLMILGLMLSDLAYEVNGIVQRGNPTDWPGHAPFAGGLAYLLRHSAAEPLELAGIAGFWLHSMLVLAFLNFLPFGKHFHILTVLPNVLFRNLRGIGRIRSIPDIEGRLERGETLGIKTARDLSWKDALDLYTCTECGRCTDNCPAFNTGKLLSPKHLTIQMRDHMYRNEAALVATAGADGPKGFVDVKGAADESGGQLVPGWIDPEALWACTSCGACEQECPVFITYVDKIIGLRRNLVLEQGTFPDQLQTAFRGLESVGNPYSFPNEQRAAWAEGLDVPLLSDKPDAAVLFWVGCAPSFDDRSRRIARALAQLLKAAGVDFAILGPQEQCTGDPARRAGNEYLFEMFAKNNVETLNGAGVKKIVTTCPHCFNTLRNEYPDFGGRYEVVHHTEFLAQLIREGKLRPQHHVTGSVVFHDSCYLGRYNEIYEPPRELLRRIPGLSVVEAPESRDRGMCCGAGGAQMWKEDEPIRRPGSREGDGKVNHARTRQLLRVLPTAPTGGNGRYVASACPFCKTMLSDGLTDQGHGDVAQLDVAELLWKSVNGA